MEKIKQNIPLVVGLSLPILMVILVALSIYFPRIFSTAVPQHNFLYSTNNVYSECVTYNVQMGHLVKLENQNEYCNNWKVAPPEASKLAQPVRVDSPTTSTAPIAPVSIQQDATRFFSHNAKTNISTEITFEQAQKLNLNSNAVSPDGFEIKDNNGNGNGDIFGGIFGVGGGLEYRDPQDRFIVGHAKSTKLNLYKYADGAHYNSLYYSFQFLGWVMS